MLNIRDRVKKVTRYIEPNIAFIGLVGLIGFPLYCLIWQYLFPQPYENLFLRIIGTVSFAPLAFFPFLSSKFKQNFHWYFFAASTYSMPFFFSFMLLKNEFSFVWTMSAMAGLSFLIAIVYDWVLVSLMVLTGFILSYLCVLVIDGQVLFTHFQPESIFVYSFALVGGLVVSYRTEVTNTARILIMKSMAGSISHELRNPLNAINLAAHQLQPILAKLDVKHIADEVVKKKNAEVKKEITELDSIISSSISEVNIIMNAVLADINEKPIIADQFSICSAEKIIPEIVASFSYSSALEKEKVKLEINSENNFFFKAIPGRLNFIIYNLLKNALFYLKQFPNSVVTIGAESRTISGVSWNSIYVHDTGPGIPSEIIPQVFGDFFTSGKKEGTGLGLVFCKRNMRIFGGEIICESEFGQGENGWTRFSLLFPKLTREEIFATESESEKKKILILDDQSTNLLATKSRVEKNLPNIICDTAASGSEAIKLFRTNQKEDQNYSLILLDIQMPEMDGFAVAKEIRKINKTIPLLAFTSLPAESFYKHRDHSCFNYYLTKSGVNGISDSLLFRSISKWIFDYSDQFSYLGNEENLRSILKDKRIILADDQDLNLLMISKNLQSWGLNVTKTSSGRELLEIYQNSLDEKGKSKFDLIVTDVIMAGAYEAEGHLYNGDNVTKQIRSIERKNKVSNLIPVIAVSGNGMEKDLRYYFDCQMSDCFVKGSDPIKLVQTIAAYL